MRIVLFIFLVLFLGILLILIVLIVLRLFRVLLILLLRRLLLRCLHGRVIIPLTAVLMLFTASAATAAVPVLRGVLCVEIFLFFFPNFVLLYFNLKNKVFAF